MSVLAFALLPLAGCTSLECGDGTAEEDGVCVGGDGAPPPGPCGDGTHFDPTAGLCLPDLPPARCDPDTTTAILDENGVTWCIGVGGTTPYCILTCLNPDAGKVTVCGQLIGSQNTEDIKQDNVWARGSRCDASNPTQDGVCGIRLQFFDALQFAASPTGAPALQHDLIYLCGDGSYMAHNSPTPMLGYLAVTADDHPASGVDRWFLSASAMAVVSGQRFNSERTHVVANTTDALWTATANDPFAGQTLGEHGAYVAVFLGPDASTPERQVTSCPSKA